MTKPKALEGGVDWNPQGTANLDCVSIMSKYETEVETLR